MKRNITRRDFLNGTQVAIGASLLNPWTEVFGTDTSKFSLGSDYYPPAKTGLRGSHDGSWETMHARVAGTTWPAGAIERKTMTSSSWVGASAGFLPRTFTAAKIRRHAS
jgi:spermidine dehydrogenase